MSDLATEIADIERELLALTADQPPNPSQIVTYKVSRTTTVTDEVKTIVWDDGIPRFIQLFGIADSGVAYIYYDSGSLKVKAYGASPRTYTLVSIGAFSLV